MIAGLDYIKPEYEVVRKSSCILCGRCVRECAAGVHSVVKDSKVIVSDDSKCVACQRCAAFCPVGALRIEKVKVGMKEDENWNSSLLRQNILQASSGGILLSSMGSRSSVPVYFDRLTINASQVTNPPIDPLREPMETAVNLGRRNVSTKRDGSGRLVPDLPPYIHLTMPLMFSAMSYGSISKNAHIALAGAAEELGIMYNTGEGGLIDDLVRYGGNTVVQVASGRFGVHPGYLRAGAAIEIKMGQGAKPGIGGHLPGSKIVGDIARTRMIPERSDAISPAPHHDIYSIEDLRMLVSSLKEATGYEKPVIVKVAAVNNIAAIASGIARSGADIIAIDGARGGTGAAPTRIRDNVGIPIELAIASVDQRLREERIRDRVSIVAGGSIRSSADVVKALCLGADCCYVATAALIAMGCHLCRSCMGGNCSWGIATQRPDLVSRLDPKVAKERLVRLMRAWQREIKEFMGCLGINSIEALVGNRAMLRAVGMTERELEVLGVLQAGE